MSHTDIPIILPSLAGTLKRKVAPHSEFLSFFFSCKKMLGLEVKAIFQGLGKPRVRGGNKNEFISKSQCGSFYLAESWRLGSASLSSFWSSYLDRDSRIPFSLGMAVEGQRTLSALSDMALVRRGETTIGGKLPSSVFRV